MMLQRKSVFLNGDIDWCRRSTLRLLRDFDAQGIIYLSDRIESHSVYKSITQKQAQKQLGKEFDAVVFDASKEFNADSFGAIVGTIKAGGVLIVLLPNVKPDSLWLQRFIDSAHVFCSEHDDFYHIEKGDDLPILTVPQATPRIEPLMPTADQTRAIEAIVHVVKGHRRRPLVLSSDRGRGKSSALGMAAAKLIQQGKQSIIVTAPSLATVDTVFVHARQLLPEALVSKGHLELGTASIRFIAPDALLESDIKADLVLVDEAAAIPAAMLAQLLNKFSRIVFSSTLHGYEGTGLGFAIRFKHTLDTTTPNWRSVEMAKPIRWAEDDVLEAFSFKALLLNAEPVKEAVVADCQREALTFEYVDKNVLLRDEKSLSELFGLMVLAHYRTRPSDLQMMLDRDDISVYAIRFNEHIIASAWCVAEGMLEDDLAEAIYAGERRLKGHLLPQSLLAHAGLVDAGGLSYQRIIRLAVHPVLQGQGIGQYCVQQLSELARKEGIDALGTSFASSCELIRFWSHCDFMPLRLGLHHDEVSGSHAMMMLKPLTEQGKVLAEEGMTHFSEQWPSLLQQPFQQLKPELVITISQLFNSNNVELLASQQHEIAAFAHRQRGFDVCQYTLMQAMSIWVSQAQFLALSQQQQALCVMLILQRRTLSEVAKSLPYSGKAEVIAEMRQTISVLSR